MVKAFNQLRGQQPVGGMKRPKWDPRHFSFSKKFGAAVSSEIPTDDRDVWVPLVTKDQGLNELCTDYGTTGAAEPFTGVINDEAFQRAAHNAVAGTPGYVGGADPDQAALAAIRFGLLPKKDAPFTVSDDPKKFADLSAYPLPIVLEAGALKEVSKYDVDGQDDLFDSIRDAMFVTGPKNNFKTVVMVGSVWRRSWLYAPGGIITTNDENELSSDHEFNIVGQKNINGVLYAKAHLSSGTEYGDAGFFYFPRWIVNTFIFAKAFGPGNPNDYKQQLWTVLQKLYNALYSTFLSSKNVGYPPTAPKPATPPVTPIAPAPAPIPVPPAIQDVWGDPVNAKKSVLAICAEQKLSPEQTNILQACVRVESGFNPSIIHANKDGNQKVLSTDYGICQINDFYHIGAGKEFPSVEFVLDNPAACVRWMCKMFLVNRQTMWVSYTSGAYKRYLD